MPGTLVLEHRDLDRYYIYTEERTDRYSGIGINGDEAEADEWL